MSAESREESQSAGRQEADLEALVGALAQLERALDTLDATGAPPEIGAAVDLAVRNLRNAIDARRNRSTH